MTWEKLSIEVPNIIFGQFVHPVGDDGVGGRNVVLTSFKFH